MSLTLKLVLLPLVETYATLNCDSEKTNISVNCNYVHSILSDRLLTTLSGLSSRNRASKAHAISLLSRSFPNTSKELWYYFDLWHSNNSFGIHGLVSTTEIIINEINQAEQEIKLPIWFSITTAVFFCLTFRLLLISSRMLFDITNICNFDMLGTISRNISSISFFVRKLIIAIQLIPLSVTICLYMS